MTPNERVRERSGGRCEGMITTKGAQTRCWKGPVEIHHMLTRARGGAILDSVNEIYHLIALCPRCHRAADGQEAYEGGILIDGYITRDEHDWPVYNGSDEYLSEKYPRRD